MKQMMGKQSLELKNEVYVISGSSIAGSKEKEGPLGLCFDRTKEDPMMGMNSWEEAESALQEEAASLAIEKAGIMKEQIRMIFAGDLLAQSIASQFWHHEAGTASLRTVRRLFHHG